jgi:hypothetical protein
MGLIGISVTKDTAFRNAFQPFSNVYYYKNGLVGGLPGTSAANDLIDELVAHEKSWHGAAINFRFARCWSYGLGETLNTMLAQKPLTGTGSATNLLAMDKERAYLIRWRAGVDSRGNPVYLRKYYHTAATWPGFASPVSTAVLANEIGFTTTERNEIESDVAVVTRLGTGDPEEWVMCGPTGRDLDTGNPTAHPYLEHHQLGDVWRGG